MGFTCTHTIEWPQCVVIVLLTVHKRIVRILNQVSHKDMVYTLIVQIISLIRPKTRNLAASTELAVSDYHWIIICYQLHSHLFIFSSIYDQPQG